MSRRALPLIVTIAAFAAAACGSSATKSAASATTVDAMHATTTADAMHTTTTVDAMHAATTAGDAMAHLAGAMSSDYIKATDQTSDGTKLVVEDVGLTGHRGFVVAVADNAGAMGDQLGVSAVVAAGATMGVNVPLSKPLTASSKVFVVLHIDNGDGAFTAADQPATVDGKVVELPIQVTVK